jgi:hypothetical protein
MSEGALGAGRAVEAGGTLAETLDAGAAVQTRVRDAWLDAIRSHIWEGVGSGHEVRALEVSDAGVRPGQVGALEVGDADVA